jgi:hypothetical protein
MARQRPIIMVSSTVHYQESFLDQVFGVLEGLGYTVWMSHAGTLFTDPGLSAFDNCLQAVNACDLFLGIITGRYGSGKEGDGKSITHRELDRAISTGKPAWFLVHSDVAVARQLLRQYRTSQKNLTWRFPFRPTPVLDDLRILQMYEKAMRHHMPLRRRRGNWVQQYHYSTEAIRYIHSQFSDTARVLSLLRWQNRRRP